MSSWVHEWVLLLVSVLVFLVVRVAVATCKKELTTGLKLLLRDAAVELALECGRFTASSPCLRV